MNQQRTVEKLIRLFSRRHLKFALHSHLYRRLFLGSPLLGK